MYARIGTKHRWRQGGSANTSSSFCYDFVFSLVTNEYVPKLSVQRLECRRPPSQEGNFSGTAMISIIRVSLSIFDLLKFPRRLAWKHYIQQNKYLKVHGLKQSKVNGIVVFFRMAISGATKLSYLYPVNYWLSPYKPACAVCRNSFRFFMCDDGRIYLQGNI